MLTTRARSADGFGLVEAVVAGGLLLIAIVGGIGVFDSSRRESATGEHQQVAALQAQAEVERLRDIPYAELAINPAVAEQWVGSGQPGDPVGRIEPGEATTFRTGPGTDDTEEIVFAAADGEGVDAQTTTTVPAGSVAFELDIYRFVSWRDEECPIGDVPGTTGSLAAKWDEPASAIDSIVAAGSPSSKLLVAPLWNLLSTAVRNRITTADTHLDRIDSRLSALTDRIAGIEEIDPCDADVESLREADDTLSTLNEALAELEARLDLYASACTLFLCPGTSTAVYVNLNAAITALEDGDFDAALEEFTASLDDVDASDTSHNTKRVTVAVVLEPEPGTGPAKPVWATSVVSDPDEGLLSSP